MSTRIRALAAAAVLALGIAAGIVQGSGTADLTVAHFHGINDSTTSVDALGGTPVTSEVDADLIPANIPIHLQPIRAFLGRCQRPRC